MISTVSISNQSVTVNQTSNTVCSSSSVVLNRVYWFRRRQISPEPRPHKKSTKILGFGIFMIGVVILAISLIIGIEFPLYVSKKILKDQCILEKRHTLYESWVRDSDYRRINRVYFWTIQNKDDFINGLSSPKFVERGPYVYTETRRKLNVIFSHHRVSYQTWVSQTFNAELTRSECGENCSQADMVTVLNTELLQKLYEFGGWDGYMRAHIKNLVRITIRNLLANNTEDEVYKYLGCFSDDCHNSSELYTIPNDTTVKSLSFCEFVKMGDTMEKMTLLSSDEFVMEDRNLRIRLTESMYSALSINVTTLPYSISVKQACTNATLQGATGYTWSIYVKNVAGLPNDFQVLFNKTVGNGTVYVTKYCDISSAVFTLKSYLQTFVSWSSVLWTFRVCDIGASPETCDELTETFETVLSFLNVTSEFVDTHLLNLVSNLYKSNPDYQIVWNKSQQDLVKGYKRTPDEVDPYQPESVSGLLEHYTDFVEAYHRSPSITVSTCLDGDTTDNNMIIRDYNGSSLTPDGVHQNSQQPINGYTTSFPPSDTCRACVKSSPNTDVYDVFTEELRRSLKYRQTGETEVKDVMVYGFNVDDDDLRDRSSCGLINVTSIRKYSAVIGNPYYLQSDCEHLEKLTQEYRREMTSYIKVEPLTGRFWEQGTRFQTSVLIPHDYVGGVSRSSYTNMTYVNQPLPIYWVDKRVEIEQSVVDTFESKINHLMRVSCGGLIGLTLVSFATMCLSVFVGLLSQRKNKVTPFVEDTSHVPE